MRPNQSIISIVLTVTLVYCIVVLVSRQESGPILPDRKGYAPEQPLAFSHRLHAGELQIDCYYCHNGAEKSRHAGIPPAGVCMNCHKFVTAPLGALREEDKAATAENRSPRRIVSADIEKIYSSLGLGEDLLPDSSMEAKPLEWISIHRVPDYVYFDHRPHVAAGVSCQRCHGAVESMERVRQIESLSMGWCVNCHRSVNQSGVAGKAMNASLDCATCHY